jgi:hypothetical protein
MLPTSNVARHALAGPHGNDEPRKPGDNTNSPPVSTNGLGTATNALNSTPTETTPSPCPASRSLNFRVSSRSRLIDKRGAASKACKRHFHR